jgi:hypothetical protein
MHPGLPLESHSNGLERCSTEEQMIAMRPVVESRLDNQLPNDSVSLVDLCKIGAGGRL